MAKTMMGKVAPPFTLVDLEGKKVSLADYKGHPVVLNFWATYCGPCKLEMPWFQDLENKYKAQGLVVLGLDQDDGMAAKEVAAASKRVGVTYPILMPDDSGVEELPVERLHSRDLLRGQEGQDRGPDDRGAFQG